MKTKTNLFIALLLLALASCTSTNKIQNAPMHAGVSRTFESDYNQTLQAAREAMVESGTAIESASEVDDGNYIIIGKQGTSAWSWGEMVRVVVTKVNDGETTVRVYTEKKISVNVTAKGDYSQSILSNIELKLRNA